MLRFGIVDHYNPLGWLGLMRSVAINTKPNLLT
jgi:hypothetical protein